MLTIATITPAQGEQYYQQENYYSQEAALKNSQWWGKGAASLGLSGQIQNSVAYKNLIQGKSPDGSQQHRAKPRNKETKERAGVDLTFSAPKSVSLACLVGGDSRLEEAHRIAVLRTLEIIESRYAQTRVKGERINTGNLTVAMWHHDTSRELDPQLHTHCVVMNLTNLPNGKWQSRTDENLYYNKILLGRIYRQELALECQFLGYEIESHPKELFEIKGYTREQIEAFSKRHEQIVKYLSERDIDVNTESKVWAWRRTRSKKNHDLDRDSMLPYWHEEADLYSISHPVPNSNLELAPSDEIEASLVASVNAGIEHCSERLAAFKREDMEKFVTAKIRPFGIKELHGAISSHPDLLPTWDNRFTTSSALKRELATIRLMQQGKNSANPIASPKKVEGYLENKKLTIGQREAVTMAATTKDQFVAWQGVAGAGKTYALKQLQQLAQGYTIKGFAPSAEAAKILGSELGIETHTVARQLLTKQPEKIQPLCIWIVDEAGLLSAKDAHALLERASASQARVILVGDVRQLSAVEAGNPFASLQQAGIQTAYLNESVRQRNSSPDLQKAVKLAAAGEIAQALEHLDLVGRIDEVPDAAKRAALIASEYIKLSPPDRSETLILAGTNAERLAITGQIRARLKLEGSLGSGVEVTGLKPLDLTSVQSRYTHYYKAGDVVIPKREYKRSGLHKEQPYVVEEVICDCLQLKDLSGLSLSIDPMKFRLSVYTKETVEIAVGDRLRWTLNSPSLGRRNGQEFVVTGIEGSEATIEYKDGSCSRINLYQPLHLDYALVSTTYSSQGKTAERVLISAAADPTVSAQSFYVAISRARSGLQIIAESKAHLFEQAQSSRAKENPLELRKQPAREGVANEPVEVTTKAVEPEAVATTQSLSNQEVSLPTSNIDSQPTPWAVQGQPINSLDLNTQGHFKQKVIEQFTDSELLLAQKAVADYFAAEPEKPPSVESQLVLKQEIDRLARSIESLWQKQADLVKLVESMQRNPFSARSKKYNAQFKQLETTIEAISQSLAQKDQKETQQKQWSKQSLAYQEWSANPQTIAMRQLAADLNQPQVQCRLEALKQELNRQDEQLSQSPDYQLQQHLQSLNPQQLWSHYSSGLEPQHRNVAEIATRTALRDQMPHDLILKMLTHSRQYKSCERQYGSQNAQRLANLILNASIRKEQQQTLMVAQTVSLLLNQMKLGERQRDGSLLFKSQSFEYRQYQSTISLIALDGREEILRVMESKVVVDSMTMQDMEKCLKLRREIDLNLQKLVLPETEQKQSRGLSR
jgi:conjugative relaxase-like TrwC/TraI family protein